MENEKGFIQIVLIAVLLLAIAGVGAYYYFVVKPGKVVPVNTSLAPQYQQAAQNVAPINNANDLNSASANLDGTDTTQIDSQLNQLNSDASF